MERKFGKNVALFLAVAVSYCGMFGWQSLAWKKYEHNWASTLGIVAAIIYSVGDRFIKWVSTAEFQRDKLAKPFIITILIYVPNIMFMVLPGLRLPCNVWSIDAFVSFFTTCFFLNNASTTAISKTFERLEKLNKNNGDSKKIKE